MKKILFFGGIILLVLLASFYYQRLPISVEENLWLKEFVIFGVSFKMVNILIISIAFCTSSMSIILLFILFNRHKMETNNRIKERLLVEYQGLLMKYIISESPNSEIKRIKEIATDKFTRQLLIDQICDLSINLKEESFNKMRRLYYMLGLYEDTFRKINSLHWHIKVKGFKELSSLDITEKNDTLYRYVNSKNHILRMEAQITLVDLSVAIKGTNPFEFLGKITYPFSLWEQITLHQIMVQKEIKPPDFGQWLNHDNHTVVMFCLRMIREYNQNWNSSNIANLMSHPDEDVRRLSIEVLGDLKLSETLLHIKKIYKDESYINQLELIKSMGKCPISNMTGFLQKIIDKEDDANIQIEAMKAINRMENGSEVLNKMIKSEYKNYNIVIQHVLDNKIN